MEWAFFFFFNFLSMRQDSLFLFLFYFRAQLGGYPSLSHPSLSLSLPPRLKSHFGLKVLGEFVSLLYFFQSDKS